MRRIKRISAWILTLAILLTLTVPALAASGVQNEVQGSAAYMVSAVKSPEVGSIGGEWAIIGLARSGYTVPTNYYEDYYARVEKYVKNCSGVLHERKYTEYSRVILALTAIGRDPSKVAGYNLLMPLGDFEKTIWQGLNGPIWALIALDSGNYEIPKNPAAKTQATRQLYIDEILNSQMKDGGWSLTGTGDSDVDISAMALQALAKYQDQKAVKTATDKALTYLSKAQDSKGGYASWGTTNVESVAQVVVALCELGVSLDDSRFVKSGHTLTENLLSFRQSNGGFYHVLDGSDGNNQMSSEQGFYALVAIDRAANGQNSLYRMSDAAKNTSKPATSVSKGNVDASVSVPGVTAPGTTFSDIKNHANKAAIEELASRGIINGMGKGTFAPNKTMTARNLPLSSHAPSVWRQRTRKPLRTFPAPNGTPVTSAQPTAAALSTALAAASLIRTAPSPGRRLPRWSPVPQNCVALIHRWTKQRQRICWHSSEITAAWHPGRRNRWRSATPSISSTRVTSILNPQKRFCAARSHRCFTIC